MALVAVEHFEVKEKVRGAAAAGALLEVGAPWRFCFVVDIMLLGVGEGKRNQAIGDKRSTAKVQPVDPHSGDRGSAVSNPPSSPEF